METLIRTVENKLMKFIGLVAKDMATINATINAQTAAIKQLQSLVVAQNKTLAGFNDMSVGYSPNPLNMNASGPRTASVPSHAPMTPQVSVTSYPNAGQTQGTSAQRMPVAHATEEDAVFFSGGEDD